ncbi:hypothetical protein HRbin03_00404 [archaeon HR03]|uniref:MoaD/ThiS family protein n=2 Tax=Thermoproteati TaxID=1783275 RepID=E6NAM3_CALS0|nr:hypothetical protein HGMM_F31D11C11 [Candidatus Caldarchaeum subterraneum]BAL57035.1 hypothetical protein HGMM_F46F11C24 [uncultured crenarchaeote]GBC72573.1 hypothetical protein HRbin03_00404 [archaeon HR03]
MHTKIKVQLVGPIAHSTGLKTLEIELQKENAKLSDLLETLSNRLPQLRNHLIEWATKPGSFIVSVDGEVVRDAGKPLNGGETVLIAPVLVGGSVQEMRVRCLNCGGRIDVPAGASEVLCPSCGTGFLVSWVSPSQPKIRGVKR